jgi:hypothetical protein
VNVEPLEKFERSLDTWHPDRSDMPVNILGFGEMSAVIEFPGTPEYADTIFKRLPIFQTDEEAAEYESICREYIALLGEAGIRVPHTDFAPVRVRDDLIVFYVSQRKISPECFGNCILHRMDEKQAALFLERVLREIAKVWEFNYKNRGDLEITLDYQLSNWAVAGGVCGPDCDWDDAPLCNIDVATPFVRRNGREGMNPRLLLRACPPPLRAVLDAFVVDEVVARYYDPRKSVIDIVANYIKEEREDLIPGALRTANSFFSNHPLTRNVREITLREIYEYYREDAAIWVIYLESKKLDRFIKTKIRGVPYDFILPEKVKRNFPLRNKPAKRG